jgi:DNA-binding LytR/AlgR family response regulator
LPVQSKWHERTGNFVDRTFLQSTLRELQVFLRSARFWATFAVVVLLFTITGPYGTMNSMPVGTRFAYWLLVQTVAWSIAISFSVMAEILLRRQISSMFWRMMVGSLVAAVPIAASLSVIGFALTGDVTTLVSLLQQIVFTTPLCALFCLLTYMTMHSQIAAASGIANPTIDKTDSPVPILARLKPENRGPILRLTVQDHYTEVVTNRGRELILLRFADAIRETGTVEGMRLHRSHWVAYAHVERLKRDNGKLFVVMQDGTAIPVSRPYAEDARRRFR